MNLLRKLQFMIKGYLNFTRREEPLPALTGSLNQKIFVITGGNSGIGYAAASQAAKRGATVVLVCRSKQRGEEAVDNLKKSTENQNIFLVLCELGEQESMKKAVSELKERFKNIDILVHNGGCMLHERAYTKEGVQKNFATNTLAVYYLSSLIFPLMTPQSRTIVVSSGGCLTQTLQIDDLFMEKEEFDGTAQYARNKRQQLCLIEELAKKYPQAGKFFTMHPGWSDTPSLRESMPDFYNKMKDKLKSPEEGADTILYLSLAPFESLQNGEFYFDREVASKHLPISLTGYKQKEANILMKRLEELSKLQ